MMKKNILKNPPYLEVAFDIPDWRRVEGIIRALPRHDAIIIEAGTPLIKRYGVEVCQKIHQLRPDSVVLADLKTLGYGRREARMAGDATADVMAFAGVASIETQEAIIEECHEIGVLPLLDTISLHDPIPVLNQLRVKPDIVELHRAIDLELTGAEYQWGDIPEIKEAIDGGLVAVAGGIKVPKVKEAQASGADILVVGRAITCAKNVNGAARAFLMEMGVE
ncbi:MAG: orotidine 5'-phosphate decarboxylase [Candidatus Hydrothermarchaeota archaeon]|nr:orotidine 5'-phosphate decarboxylase [Candidatus Hydrothermarchaeota archaeon]